MLIVKNLFAKSIYTKLISIYKIYKIKINHLNLIQNFSETKVKKSKNELEIRRSTNFQENVNFMLIGVKHQFYANFILQIFIRLVYAEITAGITIEIQEKLTNYIMLYTNKLTV